jgi:hypothetical protein
MDHAPCSSEPADLTSAPDPSLLWGEMLALQRTAWTKNLASPERLRRRLLLACADLYRSHDELYAGGLNAARLALQRALRPMLLLGGDEPTGARLSASAQGAAPGAAQLMQDRDFAGLVDAMLVEACAGRHDQSWAAFAALTRALGVTLDELHVEFLVRRVARDLRSLPEHIDSVINRMIDVSYVPPLQRRDEVRRLLGEAKDAAN